MHPHLREQTTQTKKHTSDPARLLWKKLTPLNSSKTFAKIIAISKNYLHSGIWKRKPGSEQKCIAQGHTATDKHRARFRRQPIPPSAGPISTAEMADSKDPKDTHANISLGLNFVI